MKNTLCLIIEFRDLTFIVTRIISFAIVLIYGTFSKQEESIYLSVCLSIHEGHWINKANLFSIYVIYAFF